MIGVFKWCVVFFIIFIIMGLIAMWTSSIHYAIMFWILAFGFMMLGNHVEVGDRLDIIEELRSPKESRK